MQQRAGGPNEWMPIAIFFISGLLAHQHQLGVRWTFSRHGLRTSCNAEWTCLRRDASSPAAFTIKVQSRVHRESEPGSGLDAVGASNPEPNCESVPRYG
jgi:hypothetical protein